MRSVTKAKQEKIQARKKAVAKKLVERRARQHAYNKTRQELLTLEEQSFKMSNPVVRLSKSLTLHQQRILAHFGRPLMSHDPVSSESPV